jgi:hypothetical protein
VAGRVPSFRRDPVRRFAQTAFVEIADENGCALFHRALGSGIADAGSGSGGDDNGLALQQAAGLG